MTHFVGIAVANTQEELKEIIAPYSERLKIEPYVEFLSAKDIELMKNHYGITSLKKLKNKIEDWNGYKGYYEEGKLGYYSTYNPKFNWSYYTIGGRWDNIVPGNSCLVKDLELHFKTFSRNRNCVFFLPSTLVTKDGWFDAHDWGWWEVENNAFRKVFNKNLEKLCYIVDFSY